MIMFPRRRVRLAPMDVSPSQGSLVEKTLSDAPGAPFPGGT